MNELDRGILRLLRSVQRGLDRLVGAHLVESPSRGIFRLTGAGSRAALRPLVPEPIASLDALAALPAEHRAVLRLIEDAVVARRALGEIHLSNWPGFVLLGPTKSGKTLIGRLALDRFGLDPAELLVVLAARQTPGGLLARTGQAAGGAWQTTPSRLLAAPLVVLDDVDKAPPDLQQALFPFLMGESRFRGESGPLGVSATAVITLNTERDPARLLSDAVLRRSVVLDTAALAAATTDLDLVAYEIARATIPTVREDLEPPAPGLPKEAWGALRGLLHECLTPRGWGLVDVESVSRLVFGRWATMPGDLEAAVVGVAADYLLVSATRDGFVQPDWADRVESILGPAVESITPILATERARQAASVDREAVAERAAFVDSIELAGTRERLLHLLDAATRTSTRSMTAPERASFAEVRGRAHRLRVAVTEARSRDTLAELEADIERAVLVTARGITGAVEGRRQAVEQTRQYEADARRQKAERAKADHAAVQAAGRKAKARRAVLQALAKRTTTRPEENVCAALRAAGCLMERREKYEKETLGSQLRRGVHSIVGGGPPPAPEVSPARMDSPFDMSRYIAPRSFPASSGPTRQYETRTRVWHEDLLGRERHPSDLVAWGSEPVRAVLVAAASAAGVAPLTFPARRVGGAHPPARRVGS